MKITLCGSIVFMDKFNELEVQLKELGFEEVFKPIGFGGNEKELKEKLTPQEDGQRKIKYNLINEHFQKILKSDCVLITNYEKNGIQGYIGGNTFLEMGFAFVLGKPIFLLNPLPQMSYSAEMEGMQPIIINNNLKQINDHYTL